MEQISRTKNRNIRIFISSTFSDMQEERDHLINKVFPLLRRKAEERSVSLTEVDLRWGITKEDSDSGRTVSICMEEIDNTRPFFIGLLGHRYGSTGKDLKGDYELSSKYEWLKHDLDEGLSITEIEIQYGALRQSDVHAAFYIKSQDFKTANGEIVQFKTDKRQEALKDKIKKQNRYPTHDYDSIEKLGKLVEEDFMKLLNQLYPIEKRPAPEKLLSIRQWNYVEDKCRIYVSNGHIEKELDERIKSNGCYTAITSQSGMGKSTMLSHWILEQTNKKNFLILPYFAGSIENDSFNSMLKYVVTEIASLCKIDNPLLQYDSTLDTKQLDHSFCDIINKVPKGKKLIVVFDGIDRMLESSYDVMLNWLPINLPKNVYIIMSAATENKMSESFVLRHIHTLPLYPLLADQRHQLINSYFKYYSKHLDEQQMRQIMQNRGVLQNTLMLSLFLDETRTLGRFDEMDNQISQMIDNGNIIDFLSQILICKEKKYSSNKYPYLVKTVLLLLALSKEGLSEIEIQKIAHIPQLFWSYFYCGSRLLFSEINGRIIISHPRIKQAILDRYMQDVGFQANLRRKTINYFQKEKIITLHSISEVSWQLAQLKEWDKLYRYMLDVDHLNLLMKNENKSDFIKYWSKLLSIDTDKYDICKYIQMSDDYLDSMVIKISKKKDKANKEKMQMTRQMLWNSYSSSFHMLAITIYSHLNDYKSSEKIIRYILSKYRDMDDEYTKNSYVEALSLLASVIGRQERFEESIELFENVYKIKTDLYGKEDIRLTTILVNMAEIYSVLGERGDRSAAEKARDIDEEVLAKRLKIYGKRHRDVAIVYANLSAIYDTLGDVTRSDQYQQIALEIYKYTNGNNDYDLALEYRNHAIRLNKQKRYKEAESAARKALDVFRAALGEGNPNMKDSWLVLYYALEGLQKYDEAAETLEKYELFLTETEKTDYRIYLELAIKYRICKKWDKSITNNKRSLQIIKKNNNIDLINQAYVHETLARTYELCGKAEKSIKEYEVTEELFSKIGDVEKAAFMRNRQASILVSCSKIKEALKLQDQAIMMFEKALLVESESYAFCLYDRGLSFFYLQEYTNALKDLEKAAYIREKLYGSDDERTHSIKKTIAQIAEKIGTEKKDTKAPILIPFVDKTHLEEDYPKFCEIAGDYPELCKLFRLGCQNLDQLNGDASMHSFNQALKYCDEKEIDSDDIIRAHILRLWALVSEQFKDESRNTEIERAYEESLRICEENEDWDMASRCAFDMCEFNWLRENYEAAESGYLAQLECLLKQDNWDKFRIWLTVGNIGQTLLKRDYMEPELIASISFVQLCEASFNGIGELERVAKNVHWMAITHLEETQEDFKIDNYEPEFWPSMFELTDYLLYSERPYLSYQLLNMVKNEHCVDLYDEDQMNLYLSLHVRISDYIAKTGDPEWSIEMLEKTMEIMDSHGVEQSRKAYLIHLLGRYALKTMDYERAYKILSLFNSPSDKVLIAECLYQLGKENEAMDILRVIDDSFWEEAPATLVLTLLKTAIALKDEVLSHKAFNYLKIIQNLSPTCRIALTIYALPLYIMSRNDNKVVGMIQEIKDEMHKLEETLNPDDMAFVYVSMIDSLVRSNFKHEAKDILADFSDYLDENYTEDSTFWEGFNIIESRVQ